jgi:hypothetical protein
LPATLVIDAKIDEEAKEYKHSNYSSDQFLEDRIQVSKEKRSK